VKKNRYHEGRRKHLKRYGDGWTDHGREYYQQLLGIFKTSSREMYGIHYKIIGKCIRRNSARTKGMIIKMMKKGDMTKNATKATKKIGELKSKITLSEMELMTH